MTIVYHKIGEKHRENQELSRFCANTQEKKKKIFEVCRKMSCIFIILDVYFEYPKMGEN